MNREFRPRQLTTVTPPGGWQFHAGAFVQTAVSDIVGYHETMGRLWVGRNTGSSFTFTQWASVSPATGWKWTVGDFSGGTGSDVLGYYPANGTLWVGTNTGTNFQLSQWGTVTPATGWQFQPGFFTGGAKADIVGYYEGNGTLWVGRNTGSVFTFEHWGTLPTAAGRQLIVGDFTGTGRPDVALYDPNTGAVTVGENGGNGFTLSQWGSVSPAAGWTLGAGYFTGRAKADLYAYYPVDGTIWVGENRTGSFLFTQWGSANPAAGWQFVPGIFNADLWVDLLAYHPSNGSVWLWESLEKPVEGYCWPLSAAPGETISFRTSGGGACTATFRRHTSVGPTVDSTVMHSVNFTSPPQDTPPEPFRTGCGWTETFQLTVPNTWSSGFYSATCTDSQGLTSEITFVVNPEPAERSQVALLANVNTWNAYNGWGGLSKYGGLSRSSALRPNPGAAPGVDPHLTRGELWIHGWLESSGYKPDVYTDQDFHNDGLDATQYKLLVVGTHPEYWTVQMYDRLLAYLDAGGSLAYLGGNGLFETCTYAVDGTETHFLSGVEGGPRGDGLFRVVNGGSRAERSVLGVATERCSVPGSPYQVLLPAHPLFAGTGATTSTLFGTAGLNMGFGNGKASSWEVDTANGVGAVELPWDCALTDTVTVPPSTLPAGLVVIARGTNDAPEDGGAGPGADMTYYDHPGGGFVFSVGSITFGGSLVGDAVMQQLMRNVLSHAGVVLVP
ncbi:MAG TPA: VCBS repeat-containing protein [Pseudonocardiaceae bacterium]